MPQIRCLIRPIICLAAGFSTFMDWEFPKTNRWDADCSKKLLISPREKAFFRNPKIGAFFKVLFGSLRVETPRFSAST